MNYFKNFGIKCKINKNKNYYYLSFDFKNSAKFINLIYKYIHQDLFYKLIKPDDNLNNKEIEIDKEITETVTEKYIWNNKFLNYGTLNLTGKEYIKNKSKYVYDIEVKDNHNFILARKIPDKNIKQYCDGPIVSNCHHLGARIFSRIFYKVGSKYNLGLSATLTRADGLTKVIKYFLGDIIVSLKLSILTPNVLVHYTSIEPLEEKKMINGKINMPGMINDLCSSFMRNLEIVNIIKQKYNEGRKILVLSDRRNHCNEMRRMLNDEEYINNSGLYYGRMKNEALQLSNTKRIIFATYHIASEGYDNQDLDTLIFATPKTNIEQAVGRILRKQNENEPEVIDIVDAWSIFSNLFFARMKFYKRKKYSVSNGNSNISKNKKDEENSGNNNNNNDDNNYLKEYTISGFSIDEKFE